MGNGSGIGLGGGGTGVTGRGKARLLAVTGVLILCVAGCQSSSLGPSAKATFEPDPQVPIVLPGESKTVRTAGAATEWATVRLEADWNDVEAALEVAQTEAETAVVRELSGAVRAPRAKGESIPSLRRTFELLSISGQTGLLVVEAERLNPPAKSGATHQMVLRAELHSAVGADRERAAKFVEAAANRLEDLAGRDAAPVR